jgi:prepilin-type N-terminal cleavage/methylation domain-containing protein
MRNDKGFTLIELLVVVAILGILAAIALPQYSQYRSESYCARVTADAKNAYIAMEAYYAAHLHYGSLQDTSFKGTQNVTVQVDNTNPLIISASDDTGTCTRGTYTLSEGSGSGSWS